MSNKLEERITYSNNRVSNNLKYLNETIDKIDFDFEFNIYPNGLSYREFSNVEKKRVYKH